MFDFFKLPEINDSFFRALFFLVLLLWAFFACDYWLLTKSKLDNVTEIKLVDFFVSRLRLFIPIQAYLILVYVSFDNGKSVNYNLVFLMTFLTSIICFYISAWFFKLTKEKHSISLLLVIMILVIPIVNLSTKGESWFAQVIATLISGLVAGCIAPIYEKIKNRVGS